MASPPVTFNPAAAYLTAVSSTGTLYYIQNNVFYNAATLQVPDIAVTNYTVIPFMTDSTTQYLTPSGANNDHVAINAAIVSLGAAGGGTLNLGPGTFKTTGPIVNYQSNVNIVGAGRNLTFIQPQTGWASITDSVTGVTIAGAICCVGAQHFSVQKLTVDWSGYSGTAGNGIIAVSWGTNNTSAKYTIPCKYGYFSDCTVTAKANSATYLYWCQLGQYIKMFRNIANGSTSTYQAALDQNGYEIFGGYDVEIFDNVAVNIGGIGYIAYSDTSFFVSNVEKVRFHHNSGDLMRIGLMAQVNYNAAFGQCVLRQVEFDNNQISSVFYAGAQLYIGNSSAAPATQPIFDGINVHDNVISGATTAAGAPAATCGFWAQNSQSAQYSVTAITKANPGVITIGANTLAVGDSIYISGVKGMEEMVSGYYTVNTIPTPNSTITVAFNGTAVDTTAYTTYTSGGTVDPQFAQFKSIQVHDNHFLEFAKTDSGGQAFIQGFNNIQFHHNVVKNQTVQASGSGYSMLVNGTSVGNVISDNIFDMCRSASIALNPGINTTVERNQCLNYNQAAGGVSAIYLYTSVDTVLKDNRMKSTVPGSFAFLINVGTANGVEVRNNSYIGWTKGMVNYNVSGPPTNTNFGVTAAIAAGSTSFTVTTTRCYTSSIVTVSQTAGTTSRPPIKITPAAGSFTVTIIAGTGDETYTWFIS